MLDVLVQPRASRTAVIGTQGDSLKIALSAPPVAGAANEALCKLLAKEFGVAKGKVRLTTGSSSRRKRLAIDSPVKIPAWLK